MTLEQPLDMNTVMDEAKRLIYGERAQAYGPARRNFTDIATLWSVVLKTEVTAEQALLCMALLKAARLAPGLTASSLDGPHHDSIVDAIGYFGLIDKVQHE